MRILIDGRPIVDQYAGIGTLVYNLLVNMTDMIHGDEIDILAYDSSKNLLKSLSNDFNLKSISYKYKKIYNVLFDVLNMPISDFCFGKHDIIHQTYFASLPTLHKNTKIISTIHDIAFLTYPDFFVRNNLFVSKIALNRQINKSDKIIAVSDFTKRELVNKCKVDPKKIIVIHNGIEGKKEEIDQLAIEGIKVKYGIDKPYVLFIGTLEPRKNIERLIKAFSLMKSKGFQLVVVGKKGWYYENIFKLVGKLKLGNSVVFTGYLSDEEKKGLLSGARIFAYPSLYEGFGIPILEALLYGLPVLAGNNSAMPEVVGDAGLLVDALEVDQIAAKMDILLQDESLSLELKEKAKKQIEKFSWKKAAEKTVDLYQEIKEKE
jgi:glycosyltransferase involved in cell wall biosynthesis